MAFRATNVVPADALPEIKRQVTSILRLAQNRKAVLQSTVGAEVILAFLENLLAQKSMLNAKASTPGLAKYAKDQEGDPNYDIVAEFLALGAAIDGVVAEITTTFPTSTFMSLAADGTKVFQQIAPAQTVNLRAKIDALIAAIS